MRDDFTKMVRNSFIQNNDLFYNSNLNYHSTQKMMKEIEKNIEKNEVLKINCVIS